MEEYNPNAIWESRKKKVEYTPPEPMTSGTTAGERGLPPGLRRTPSGSGKKTAIIAGAAIVVVGIVCGTWFFATRPAPAPVVGLGAAVPSEVPVGDPFTFSVLYENSSTVPLKNASLAVTVPAGIFFSGEPQSEQTLTVPIGDVAAGSASSTDIQMIATAGAGSVVQVSSTLSYGTGASHGTLFGTSNQKSFAVGTPVIGLAISMPANVFAGQGFTTNVSYKNAASHPIDGVKITMQYPSGFTFTQASPTPAFPGNTTWNLGSLAPGAGGTIFITGTMTGKNTALYSLSGTVAENVSGALYEIGAGAANVAITAAPLTIGAVVNNDSNYIAKLNDYLDYKITYANVSDTTFQNIKITAVLAGGMFDPTSVQSDASFNSRTGTLTWYPANTPELASVAPGASGSVDLRVKVLPSFKVTSASNKNFTIGLHLNVSSPTVPAGTAATSTSASADVTNKVSGVVAVDAVGYRYEPSRSIINSGPYPPKVNQMTTYTIHWRVTDYSTDVSGVTVSAYLQNGATCTGKITSSVSAAPVCDAGTGQVTWTIPSISAGTGVLGAPLEAVFQVENMPAVNQAGETVTLIGKTSLTATDNFTGATLAASANPVGTDIPNDTAVTASNRTVQQ